MDRPEALDASGFSEDQIEDTIKLWDDVAKGQEDMVSVSSDDRPQDATEVPIALPGVELLFFNPLTCEASVRYHGQVMDLPVYLKVREGPALVMMPDGAELATPYPPKLVGGSSGTQAKAGPEKKTKKQAAKAKQSTKQKVKVLKRPAALVEDAMKRPAAVEDATSEAVPEAAPATSEAGPEAAPSTPPAPAGTQEVEMQSPSLRAVRAVFIVRGLQTRKVRSPNNQGRSL